MFYQLFNFITGVATLVIVGNCLGLHYRLFVEINHVFSQVISKIPF